MRAWGWSVVLGSLCWLGPLAAQQPADPGALPDSSRPEPAPPPPAPADVRPAYILFNEFSGMELNPVQQSKLERMADEAVSKIEQTLDEPQRQMFSKALLSGQDLPGAVSGMQLTDSQILALRSLFQSLRSQFLYMLSRPQKRELMMHLRTRRPE